MNTKNYKYLLLLGKPTGPLPFRINPGILDILCHISNLLDLNSDHSAVLFTLISSTTMHRAPLYLFNQFTDIGKFKKLSIKILNLVSN